MRMSRRGLVAATVATMLATAACESGTGVPVPGELAVVLGTEESAGRALLLRVSGPMDGMQLRAAPGYVVHGRVRGDTLHAAVFGTLAPGELFAFSVPDVARAARYAVSVEEVAGADNELFEDDGAFTLVLER
jgi:hypothetical protein